MSSENRELTEKCGIVGIVDFDGNNTTRRTASGLISLHTRGDDAAGILALGVNGLNLLKNLGRTDDILSAQELEKHGLEGSMSIGHTRYKIQGGDRVEFAGPLVARFADRRLGLAHNGNIPEPFLSESRRKLAARGIYPEPDFDSNILANLIVSAEGDNWVERVQNGLEGVHGSLSALILTYDRHLLAVRDAWGNRPLCVGKLENGIMVASETIALDTLNATNWYELQAGEILDISDEGILRSSLLEEAQEARCVFERIYFGYETSIYDGEPLSRFRQRLGVKLAQNHPGSGEVVTAIPESACVAARAYAETLGKPEERLILKRRLSVGRSFMQGEMGDRKAELDGKFYFSSDMDGKAIDLVEDSVVCGNTTEITTAKARQKGARRQDLRTTAPPVIKDCNWGITMRSSNGSFVALDELTGERLPYEKIAEKIGVDSIDYISLEELQEVVAEGGHDPENFCYECLGGKGLEPAVLKSKRPGIENFTFDQELHLEKPLAVV